MFQTVAILAAANRGVIELGASGFVSGAFRAAAAGRGCGANL